MPSATPTTIKRVNGGLISDAADMLATEEPLEIRLAYGPATQRLQKNISVTMRTPGNDTELAIGFLYTEGIINDRSQIISANYIKPGNENILLVSLAETVSLNISSLERNFYTTSSCGVCGKASI
jgi:FdhD protein